MIKADTEKVEISFPATPLLTMAYLDNPSALEKSVIVIDLKHIFTALVAKYDISTCADLISIALESMIKELDEQGEQNDNKS